MADYHVRATGTLGGDGSAANPWLYLDQLPVAASIPADSNLYVDGVVRLRFSGVTAAALERDGLTRFKVQSLDPANPAIIKGSLLLNSGWTNTVGNVWTYNIGAGKTAAIFGVAVNYDASVIAATGQHYGFLKPGTGLNTWSYDNGTGLVTIELAGGENPNSNVVVELCLGGYQGAILLTNGTDNQIVGVNFKQHIDPNANRGYGGWMSGTRCKIDLCKGWDCGYHTFGMVASGVGVVVDCSITRCYGYSLHSSAGTHFVAYAAATSASNVLNFRGTNNGCLISGGRDRSQARLNPTYKVDGFYGHTGAGSVEHVGTVWEGCWTDATADTWGNVADCVNVKAPTDPTDPTTYNCRFIGCSFASSATGKQGGQAGCHVSYENCVFDHTTWPNVTSTMSPPAGLFIASVSCTGVGYMFFDACFFKLDLKNSNASTDGRYITISGSSGTDYWQVYGRNCTMYDQSNGIGALTVKSFFSTSNSAFAKITWSKSLFVYEIANAQNRLFHNDTSTPTANLVFDSNIMVGIGANAWSSAAARQTAALWVSSGAGATDTALAVGATNVVNHTTARPSAGLLLRSATTNVSRRFLNRRRNGNLRGAWQDGGVSRLAPGSTLAYTLAPQ